MLLRFPPWKIALILIALISGVVFALPNVVGVQPYLPGGQLKLGLDLRGGASILLEIDPAEVETNKLNELSRDVRQALVQRPLISTSVREVVGNELHVRPNSAANKDEAISRIRKLGQPAVSVIGQSNTLSVTERADGMIVVKLTADALNKLQADALESSIEAVRRRIDNSGIVEPSIQKQGENRILVEMPGLDDPAPLIDVLTQAGVLTFNLVDVNANSADYEPGVARNGRVALPDDSLDGQLQVIFEDPIITGSDLQTASQAFDDRNRPSISFQLRGQGAQRFGKATTENVNRPFAIVLDDRIVSAPNIISPITSGSGQITGNFTIKEAEDLAIILRSGALPAKLHVADRRTVSASLGEDSIAMGVTASLIGIVLVSVFMIAAYGLLGVFSVIALYLNLIMLAGVLSVLGATLTLPGIAGILLTVGMAVDANVIIFERIREEKRAGRSPMTSVEAGYEQAMSTILDANATTFLAAIIMYTLGAGPVRGFAVTLSIGIITSMFSAIVVSRWIISMWLRGAKPKWIPI